jgi:Sugar-transfer associated ATP-grasp
MLRRCLSFLNQFRNAYTVSRSPIRALAIVLELVSLKRAIGMNGHEYFLYSLGAAHLGREQKLAYLTRALHEKHLAPLDPPEESPRVSDKLLFHHGFAAAGVRLPRLLGSLEPRSDTDRDRAALGEELLALLRREWKPATGIVLKPARGGCGRGVVVLREIDLDATTFNHVDGRRLAIAELVEMLSRDVPTLVEERVQQHPFLKAYNSATLNTIRVVTIRDRQRNIQLAGAALKIGLDDSGVESLTEQHLAVPIDLATGTLGPGARQSGLVCDRLAVHPGSDIPIAGQVLPHWPEIRALAISGAEVVPRIGSVGWDIGLAIDGPVLIEGNEIWGEEILQLAYGRGLWTDEFRSWIGAPATI